MPKPNANALPDPEDSGSEGSALFEGAADPATREEAQGNEEEAVESTDDGGEEGLEAETEGADTKEAVRELLREEIRDALGDKEGGKPADPQAMDDRELLAFVGVASGVQVPDVPKDLTPEQRETYDDATIDAHDANRRVAMMEARQVQDMVEGRVSGLKILLTKVAEEYSVEGDTVSPLSFFPSQLGPLYVPSS